MFLDFLAGLLYCSWIVPTNKERRIALGSLKSRNNTVFSWLYNPEKRGITCSENETQNPKFEISKTLAISTINWYSNV